LTPRLSEQLLKFTLYSKVSKIERLSTNIELNINKAVIRSVITYACSAWEFAAYTFLSKLQHLQNKVLRTIGNFPRCTSVRDLHTAFNTENIRGLNLAVVKLTTVKVSKLPM
jgi:hypothetical protein